MTRPVRALINLQALQSNFQRVRTLAPSSRIMAVVKSNAYGHGAVQVANALGDADAFGVASLEEALELRAAGIKQAIVMLGGCFEERELDIIAGQGIDIVIHSLDQLAMIEDAQTKDPVSVWVKADTGMHRLGLSIPDFREAVQRLLSCENINKPLRFLSHLACADDSKSSVTDGQLQNFLDVTAGTRGERSLANSAGVLQWPETRLEWVRPGIMLYGTSPLLTQSAIELGLQPVMSLFSRLISIKNYKRGDAIGYSGDWVCPQDMSVGVAAVGYGDGYPRHAPSGTPVLVNGKRAALVGRVSMDMICIDLHDHPEAKPGDEVQLWGGDLSVDEVAEYSSTISYELLCGITSRVQREYL